MISIGKPALAATVLTVIALSINAVAAPPSSEQLTGLGFSPARLNYIDEFYNAKVKKGEMAGIVILIARHGKIAHLSAIGYADIEKKRKMTPDTIFRAYSMTKPIAAVALMMQYEQGYFQLDDPISKYIPELAKLKVLRTPTSPLTDTVPAEREPTIHDLLRHTAGFSHGLLPNAVDTEYVDQGILSIDISLAELMTKLAHIPLLYQPGATFNYSIAPDIEARLVEIFSGMPFSEFLNTRLFKPLDMKDTGYWISADRSDRLATLYWSKNGVLTPLDETHGYPRESGPMAVPQSVNGYTGEHSRKGGSFGLLTTAQDYWRFGQMLLNRGDFNGNRILSPLVVDYMVRSHLDTIQREGLKRGADFGKGLDWGLGFAIVKDPVASGFMSSEGSFFWYGLADTHFWVDPKEDLVVVALVQDMENPGDADLLLQIRTLIYSAIIK
jgi:CubicO group peptidase (beta-lactamase class C family)